MYNFLRKIILNPEIETNIKSEALDLLLSDKIVDNDIDISYACQQMGINIATYNMIQNLVKSPHSKIAAIKELRTANRWGLKESKDAVENPRFFIQPDKSVSPLF